MTTAIMMFIVAVLITVLIVLDVKLMRVVSMDHHKMIKERLVVMVGLIGIISFSIIGGENTSYLYWTSVLVFVGLIIERIYFISYPIKYEERQERLAEGDFENIDTYYFREKAFNFIGVILALSYIFHSKQLILDSPQILFIIFFRNLIMKRKGEIESLILLFLLHLGYLMKEHYLGYTYYEYVLLAVFLIFLIYFSYKASTKRGIKEILLVILGVGTLLLINNHISNNRLIKDPQLHTVVNEKYQYQYRVTETLKEGNPRMQDITDLEIQSLNEIKTLEGIEKLVNLQSLTIQRQKYLRDYSQLGKLNQLKDLLISKPNKYFSFNHLPNMENLESLTISFGFGEASIDEEIDLSKFPNLKRLYLEKYTEDQPVTIDIRNAPNLERMTLGLNIKEIVGLEDAENLKEMVLYRPADQYKEVVKRIRPDIKLSP